MRRWRRWKTSTGLGTKVSAATGEFIQGAVWCIGELLCQRFGMVWGYEPYRPVEGTSPALFTEPGGWVGGWVTVNGGHPGAEK